MSISTTDCDAWIGSALLDDLDARLGTIDEIYFDASSGRPQWLVIKSGRFARRSFVPLTGARRIPGGIMTTYDRRLIAAAPRITDDDDLAEEQAHALYRHYGLAYDALFETDMPDPPSPRERVLSYLR